MVLKDAFTMGREESKMLDEMIAKVNILHSLWNLKVFNCAMTIPCFYEALTLPAWLKWFACV
jgi:hypothetical protein